MMRAGGRVKMTLPANLAYGARGMPSKKIPPHATLVGRMPYPIFNGFSGRGLASFIHVGLGAAVMQSKKRDKG